MHAILTQQQQQPQQQQQAMMAAVAAQQQSQEQATEMQPALQSTVSPSSGLSVPQYGLFSEPDALESALLSSSLSFRMLSAFAPRLYPFLPQPGSSASNESRTQRSSVRREVKQQKAAAASTTAVVPASTAAVSSGPVAAIQPALTPVAMESFAGSGGDALTPSHAAPPSAHAGSLMASIAIPPESLFVGLGTPSAASSPDAETVTAAAVSISPALPPSPVVATVAASSSPAKRQPPPVYRQGTKPLPDPHSHSRSHPRHSTDFAMASTSSISAGGNKDGSPNQSPSADAVAATVWSSSSSSSAPRVHLHRHALESIFGFLTLAELAAVSRVSQEWSARTLTTVPLRAPIPAEMLSADARVSSRLLAVHLGYLSHWHLTLVSSSLAQLCDWAPNLTELCMSVNFDLVTPLLFPPRLLKLQLFADMSAAHWIRVIEAASTQLSRLLDFGIVNSGSALTVEEIGSIDFTPLQQIHTLRAFMLRLTSFAPDWTAEQQDQLRALPHLTSVSLSISVLALQSLLRVPHSLRWSEFETDETSGAAADALCTLPLTRLGQQSIPLSGVQSIAFLTPLSATLTHLHLDLASMALTDGDLDPLRRCVHLVELGLESKTITGDQLTSVLRCLPGLKRLFLCGLDCIGSLSCLTAAGVPLLDSLELWFMRQLPASELELLRGQSQLRELRLQSMFSEPMTQELKDQLRPPSEWFPMLGTVQI